MTCRKLSTIVAKGIEMPCCTKLLAPHLLLIITQFTFSGWHLLGSATMKVGANPLVFALYREFVANVLMYFYAVSQLKGNYRLMKIDRVDWLQFFFVGLNCFFCVLGTVVAFQYVSPIRYAILQPAIPVIATIVSCSIRLEKLTIMKAVGISVAAFGAILTESESMNKVLPLFHISIISDPI